MPIVDQGMNGAWWRVDKNLTRDIPTVGQQEPNPQQQCADCCNTSSNHQEDEAQRCAIGGFWRWGGGALGSRSHGARGLAG